jgi:hypothetical protein
MPLTALVVLYTFVSLTILAEPIVERRAPAQPSDAQAASEVDVPADAILPELGSGRLVPVGTGHRAKQKLTYRVLGSAFHDGTDMTAADLLYAYMFAYRWSQQDGDTYDPYVDAATALLRKRLVAVKVVGADSTSKSFRFGDINFVRQLFIVDVYAEIPPIDIEQDAVFAPPWTALPWHLMVLMEEAVKRRWAAFSQQEARRRGRRVEWLDLVRSSVTNSRLAALLSEFVQTGYRPETLRTLVTEDDARKRWTAIAVFYREHGHFLVSNGPYKLNGWTPEGVTLEAFRDLSYPLGVSSFDNYAVPRRGYITEITQKGSLITLSGDIEVIAKHARSYDIVRAPLASIRNDELTRSAPECRCMVTDDKGRVVMAGRVPVGDDFKFHIDLRSALGTGQFTLHAQIIVNDNATATEIKRLPMTMPAVQ